MSFAPNLSQEEVCDVTNKGRHFGRHVGFYQELEMRLKAREIATTFTFVY